jgi:spermidine synthase
MASGVYVHAEPYTQIAGRLADVLRGGEMLLYQETSDAVVSVVRVDYEMAVRTNGKGDATSHGDILTQKLLAHLPLAHHPAPRDVAVIGLASGVSLGSALTWPTVRHADCVEIVPAMKRAAALFKAYNHDCLNDPRVRIVENDGRNHLALTTQAYDVIISEPSNPWITGISALFTRDFYRQAQARLRPDGIYCQWVQTYQITREDFGAVLRTFRASFPHVSIWMGSPGDVILLGSRQPLGLDAARLARLRDFPTVRDDLAAADITDTPGFWPLARARRDAGAASPRGRAHHRRQPAARVLDAAPPVRRQRRLRAPGDAARRARTGRRLPGLERAGARHGRQRAAHGRAGLHGPRRRVAGRGPPGKPRLRPDAARAGRGAGAGAHRSAAALRLRVRAQRTRRGRAGAGGHAGRPRRFRGGGGAAPGWSARARLGSWWQASGRPESARVEFETALRLEPALRSARDELSALPPRHH